MGGPPEGPSRLLLVRHADAGVRGTWPGDDLERRLSGLGEAQAERLATTLPGLLDGGVTSIASSRAERCRATVAPLARSLGLGVVHTPLLLEGAEPAETLEWLEAPGAPAVSSSHGDVIGGVVELLADRGVVAGPCAWPKGGTWVLDREGDRVVAAHLVPPPAVG